MKAFERYLLIKREHETTTDSGIVLTSQNTGKMGIKATVVSGQYKTIKEGDEIVVNRTKAIETEEEGVYAIEPDHILAIYD